jgi:hypothetical protein
MGFLSGSGPKRQAFRTAGVLLVAGAGLVLLHLNITGPADPSLAVIFFAVAALELLGALIVAVALAFVPKEASAL